MKVIGQFTLAGLMLAISAAGFAATKNYTIQQRHGLREQSMAKYSLCDVNALAKEMANGVKLQANTKQQFDVRFVEDHAANYNYYLATTKSFNADVVRQAVCRYVNQHQCYLYWGNVANVAMIADHPAPRFPLDSSPHYMLSPSITCDSTKPSGK